jgi:hypothetical protein
MSLTGMKRVPFTHNSFSCLISKCLQAQSALTNATPTLGSIVVKGKFPVATGVSVAAEKNVDLPTFAFPSKPICNTVKNLILLISIAEIV